MKIFRRTKLTAKGFAHVEILIIAVVVVAVAAAGFLVYEHQHHKNSIINKAKAGNWSTIYAKNGYSMLACKTYINAFGGVWDIKVLYFKPASVSAIYQLFDVQGGYTLSQPHNGSAWWYNVVAIQSYDISVAYHDDFMAYIDIPGNTLSSGIWYPYYITNC